jgi:hypothetical protein
MNPLRSPGSSSLGVQGYALDAPADGICNSGGAAEIH